MARSCFFSTQDGEFSRNYVYHNKDGGSVWVFFVSTKMAASCACDLDREGQWRCERTPLRRKVFIWLPDPDSDSDADPELSVQLLVAFPGVGTWVVGSVAFEMGCMWVAAGRGWASSVVVAPQRP